MSLTLRPYPEYKDSAVPWLGEVPADWPMQPAFAAFQERQETNKGLKEKQVLSLSYGRIVKKHADALHGLVPASFETYQVVEPGNLILRLTDLQNDQRSLRVGLAKDRGIITSAYVCLSVRGHLLPEFAYYLLHAADVQKVFYGMGAGLRQSIGFADLRRLPVLIPDESEQKRIVAFLNALGNRSEKLIRAKRRIIELLNEQKRAIVDSMIGGPSVRPGWRWTRLKYRAEVQTGITLGKRYHSQILSKHPYLRVANVQSGYLDLTTVKTIEVPESEVSSSTLMRGDVLMTEGGDIDKLGRGCVWRGEIPNCLHQNHIFAVRTHDGLDPEFLALAMISKHGRAYFQSTAKQTTNLASTNQTTIRSFPLLLPSIETQQEIVRDVNGRCAEIDQANRRTTSEIDLVREYRTRLTADVVTGKIDVRGVQLPELDVLAKPETLTDADEELETDEEVVGVEEGADAAN